MKLHVTINGKPRAIKIQPSETLLSFLRRLRYFGVKHGCESGDCGACTVLLNGEPIHSCNMLAAQAKGQGITTIEGIGKPGQLHPLQEAFLDFSAVQCGFCTPAMILVGVSLLEKKGKNITEEDVRRGLAGVLCRCTGYVKPVEAILNIAKNAL